MKRHLTAGRVVCYMLVLTAACTLVLGATYSRFSSQATGTGTANIAAAALNSNMDVSEALEGMAPGESRTITFQVGNRENSGTVSEVTQSYTIAVETTGNLPLVYTLSTEDTPNADHALTHSSGSLVWTGGLLPHSTPTIHIYTLTVSWPDGESDPSLTDEIDLVSVTVEAKQVI